MRLKTFCVRSPGHIFSPTEAEPFRVDREEFTMPLGLKACKLRVSRTVALHERLESMSGVASVVGPAPREPAGQRGQRHGGAEAWRPAPQGASCYLAVTQFAYQLNRFARSLGVRFTFGAYNGCRLRSFAEAKNKTSMLQAFKFLQSSVGPLLQFDVTLRPVNEKTLLDVVRAQMPGIDVTTWALDEDIKNEWLQCCLSAVVVTSYNRCASPFYKIKAVHFDMDASSSFDMRVKGAAPMEITLSDYIRASYHCNVKYRAQPVLEAYADKPSVPRCKHWHNWLSCLQRSGSSCCPNSAASPALDEDYLTGTDEARESVDEGMK